MFDYDDNKVYYLNNPPIFIPDNIPSSVLPWNKLPLPSLNSESFPSIDNGEDYPVFSTWIHPNENGLLNTTLDSSLCDGFPSVHIPLPYAETGSPAGTFPSVFGKTPEGTDFVYDPHFAFKGNTVEDPLEDGGGQLVIDTKGLLYKQGEQVMCQNVVRDSWNEAGCRLTYHPSACAPAEFPETVIELSESNIAGIQTLTGKDVYVTENWDTSEWVLDASTGYDAPCGANTQYSRWKMVTDAVCANTAGLDAGMYYRVFSIGLYLKLHQ